MMTSGKKKLSRYPGDHRKPEQGVPQRKLPLAQTKRGNSRASTCRFMMWKRKIASKNQQSWKADENKIYVFMFVKNLTAAVPMRSSVWCTIKQVPY